MNNVLVFLSKRTLIEYFVFAILLLMVSAMFLPGPSAPKRTPTHALTTIESAETKEALAQME